MASTLAGLGLLLALVPALFLSLWNCYYQTTVFRLDPSGEVTVAGRSCSSFVGENGAVALVLLFLPPLLAAVSLGASFRGTLRAKLLMWAAAVAALTFAFLTIFSIGILYGASGLALLAAAGFNRVRQPRSQPAA